jgi:hypothetical protein
MKYALAPGGGIDWDRAVRVTCRAPRQRRYNATMIYGHDASVLE